MSFYVVVLRIRLSFEFPSGSKVIVGVPFPNFIRELCDGDSGRPYFQELYFVLYKVVSSSSSSSHNYPIARRC